ncbi:Rossmann-fold NAD(P)-binding domain-containing protein [Gemmatimonas sp.]
MFLLSARSSNVFAHTLNAALLMPSQRTAIVLGASGSVGAALMRALVTGGSFTIVSLTRRSVPEQVQAALVAGVTMHEVLVPSMLPGALEVATRDAALAAVGEVVGLSVLGIGAGTAKLTIEQHRAVDVQLNAAFARGLATSGRVSHLAFMSAAGANIAASAEGSGAAGMSRYNRVKGEAEAAVQACGLPVVSIFRPAMILGSQHTPWLLAKLLPLVSFATPTKYRSITTGQIAGAMVEVSRTIPGTSAIYHYPEMLALNVAP